MASNVDEYLYDGTIRVVTDNTVVVAPMLRSSRGDILFFTKDGIPKSRFNRKGNGPGEYPNVYKVFYDEEADDLFILSAASSDLIQVYSSTGMHKREVPLPQGVIFMNGIISLDDQSFLCHDEENGVKRVMTNEADLSSKDYFESFYLISKTDGTVLDYIELPITQIFLGIYFDGRRLPAVNQNRLIKCTEGAFLCNPENDTVFLYKPDKSLTPVLHKTPLITSTNPRSYLNNCIDVGLYQFTEVYTLRPGDEAPGILPVRNYMRNTITGEVVHPKFLLPDFKGKEFIISVALSARTSGFDNGVLFELDLIELKQALNDNRLSGKLKELVATLKEDDNNVFVMVQFH